MLIRNYRSQKILLLLSLIAFVALTIGTFTHLAFLSMLDNLTAQLTMSMLPPMLRFFLNVIYFFNHGFGIIFIIFGLCFFLWGFKYKLPAFWIMTTSVISGILLHVCDFILPVTNFGHAMQYPAFGIFWASLSYSFFAIFVVPEIIKIKNRLLLQFILILNWLLVLVTSLFQNNVQFSGILAGWLFAIILLECFEILYTKFAPTLVKMNGFYGSWY